MNEIQGLVREGLRQTDLYRSIAGRLRSWSLTGLGRFLLGPRIKMIPLSPFEVRDRKGTLLYHLLSIQVINIPDHYRAFKQIFHIDIPESLARLLRGITPNRSTGDCRVTLEFFDERLKLISAVHYPESFIRGYYFGLEPGQVARIEVAALDNNGKGCHVYGSGPLDLGGGLTWQGNDPAKVSILDDARILFRGLYWLRVTMRSRDGLLQGACYFCLTNYESVDSFRLISLEPPTSLLWSNSERCQDSDVSNLGLPST